MIFYCSELISAQTCTIIWNVHSMGKAGKVHNRVGLFHLYHGSKFYWGRNHVYQEKTSDLPNVTEKTLSKMLYRVQSYIGKHIGAKIVICTFQNVNFNPCNSNFMLGNTYKINSICFQSFTLNMFIWIIVFLSILFTQTLIQINVFQLAKSYQMGRKIIRNQIYVLSNTCQTISHQSCLRCLCSSLLLLH